MDIIVVVVQSMLETHVNKQQKELPTNKQTKIESDIKLFFVLNEKKNKNTIHSQKKISCLVFIGNLVVQAIQEHLIMLDRLL